MTTGGKQLSTEVTVARAEDAMAFYGGSVLSEIHEKIYQELERTLVNHGVMQDHRRVQPGCIIPAKGR